MAGRSVDLAAGLITAPAVGELLGILEPLLRLPAYSANHKLPSLLPPPGALVHAFVRGRMAKDMFDLTMRYNGAACFRAEQGRGFPRAWQDVIDASFAEYTKDELWRLWCRKELTDTALRNGVRVLGYRPGSMVNHVADLLALPPDPGDAVRFWRRGFFDRDRAVRHIMESAHYSETDARNYVDASAYVPGPGDLVRFMLRDVEDPKVVEPENLDFEFTEKYQGLIRDWARWQGVGDETMRRYWRAHWQYPSPGQLYECLHRLRPDNIAAAQAIVPGVKPVVLADVLRVLGIDDVAPAWRDRLAAISYRRITRRDLRIMIKWDRITLPQTIDLLRDYGYSPADAEQLGRAVFTDARPDKQESIVREGKAAIRKAYNLGAIAINDVEFLAREYGLYDDEVQRFVVGLRLADNVEMLGAAVKATKVIFLNGNYDRGQAVANMVAAGVLPDRAGRFVDLWALELLKGRRVISEARARAQYVEGVTTLGEYANVVRNLKFSDLDANRLMREAELKRIQYLESLIAKELADEKKRLRELEAALAKSAPKSQVLKWLKEGLISPEDAEARLLALGVDPADVERYFGELGAPYHGQPAKPPPPKPAGGGPRPAPGAAGSHVTISGGKIPTDSVACRWYLDDVIDERKYREYLAENGWHEPEVTDHVRECDFKRKPKPPPPSAPAP